MGVWSCRSILISNSITRFAKWPMRSAVRSMVNVVTLSSVLSVIPKKMNPVMDEQFPPSIFSLFLSMLLENDQEKDTWMCNTSAHLQYINRENTVLSAIVFIFRKLYIYAPTL